MNQFQKYYIKKVINKFEHTNSKSECFFEDCIDELLFIISAINMNLFNKFNEAEVDESELLDFLKNIIK